MIKVNDAALELNRLCELNVKMERFSGLVLRDSSDARVLASHAIMRAVAWTRSRKRTAKTGKAILDELARRSAALEACNQRIKTAMVKGGGNG